MLLAACSSSRIDSPYASGSYGSKPQQCVPYARSQSGVEIYGDAHTWWDKAGQRYARGALPKPGAVMVLEKTRRMRHGHLAVVKRIINARQIDVTHSNWGSDRESRSIIYDSMRVEDISKANNWSTVRFWNNKSNNFGFPYAVRGFIYK